MNEIDKKINRWNKSMIGDGVDMITGFAWYGQRASEGGSEQSYQPLINNFLDEGGTVGRGGGRREG